MTLGQRVRQSLQQARARGVVLGRPRVHVPPAIAQWARRRRAAGAPWEEIERITHFSRRTLGRAIAMLVGTNLPVRALSSDPGA